MIFGTQISYKDKTSEEVLGQAFKLGIAYMPINGLTIAADYGDRRMQVSSMCLQVE